MAALQFLPTSEILQKRFCAKNDEAVPEFVEHVSFASNAVNVWFLLKSTFSFFPICRADVSISLLGRLCRLNLVFCCPANGCMHGWCCDLDQATLNVSQEYFPCMIHLQWFS